MGKPKKFDLTAVGEPKKMAHMRLMRLPSGQYTGLYGPGLLERIIYDLTRLNGSGLNVDQADALVDVSQAVERLLSLDSP